MSSAADLVFMVFYSSIVQYTTVSGVSRLQSEYKLAIFSVLAPSKDRNSQLLHRTAA